MLKASQTDNDGRVETTKRGRTLPIKDTIEKVRGYNTLTIYRMEASPYWYVRYYEDQKIYRRSTKQENKRDAIKAAQEFFAEIKLAKMNRLPVTKRSGFELCARGLLKENKARMERGELSKTKQEYDEARLENDLLPYFKKFEVAEIDYKALSGYLTYINTAERKLSTNSLKVHVSHIKTILKYAQRIGVITALPAFPALKTVDKPRGWFNSAEYNKLHNTAKARIGTVYTEYGKKGEPIRTVTLTAELYDLILFMTNTFIRPTDIRFLQHRHIAIVRQPDQFLRLTHPPSKKHSAPVVSMPMAIPVYERLLARQKTEGFGRPDDYVFQPQHAENRDYGMRQLHRQFDQLLKITDMKKDARGEPRSLYSLRHTAIMFRLLHADGLDLLTLARNARTSVEIIDRFYANHLTGEMNVRPLQSHRLKGMEQHAEELREQITARPATEQDPAENAQKGKKRGRKSP